MLEPVNEMGVIVVFSQYCESVGWEILSIQAGCPDAIIRHKASQEVYRIEFEYNAGSFIDHGHSLNDCDAIICWKDDLPTYFSFPVMSLSEWSGEKPEKISDMHKELLTLRVENRKLRRQVNDLEEKLSGFAVETQTEYQEPVVCQNCGRSFRSVNARNAHRCEAKENGKVHAEIKG